MSDFDTVLRAWESFNARFIHPQAGDGQRREMRRAFYAGAYGILMLVVSTGDDGVSEEEGTAFIQGLRDEIELFALMESKKG